MELTYINNPLPKINKGLFVVILLLSVVATFTLWEFPVKFLGLIIAILFLAGVYNLPELGVGVFVNGLFLVGYVWRGFGIAYLITPLAVVLCAMGLTHYVWNRGLAWRFGILPATVLFTSVLLFVGISYSPLPTEGLIKTGRYLIFIGDLNRLKNLLKIIAFIGFVLTIISFIYIGFVGMEHISRFTLPGQNAIWFARGLGISLLATLFWMKLTPKKLQKLLFEIFFCLILFVTYITASRGPFFALLVVLILYFLLLNGEKLISLRTLSFILLIVFSFKFFIAFAPGQIFHRMLNLFARFDITTFYRLRAFEKAKDLFFAHPLMGVGTGGFGHFNILNYPHNILLELASELGIFGVLAFLVMIIYATYLGIILLRDKKASALELNLSKTFFAIFVFSLVNSQISGEISGNYELWFSVAGIWTLYSTRKRFLER